MVQLTPSSDVRLPKPVDTSVDIEQLKLQSVAAKHKAGSKAQQEALRLAQQVEAGAPLADLVFCLAPSVHVATRAMAA